MESDKKLSTSNKSKTFRNNQIFQGVFETRKWNILSSFFIHTILFQKI